MLPLKLNDRSYTRTKKRTSSTKSHPRSYLVRSRSSRISSKDRILTSPSPASTSSTSSSPAHSAPRRESSMPSMNSVSGSATSSFVESRVSLPYPAFSKAHSKEAVRRQSIPTPDPTDVTERREDVNGSDRNFMKNHHVPPSPPLTSEGQQSSRRGTPVGDRDEKSAQEKPKGGTAKVRIKTGPTKSSSSLRTAKDEGPAPNKAARTHTSSKSNAPKNVSGMPSEIANPRPSKSRLSNEGRLPKRPHSRAAASPERSPATTCKPGLESMDGSDATIGPQHSISARKLTTSVEKTISRSHTRSSGSFRSSGSRTPLDGPDHYGRAPTASSGYEGPLPPPPPPEIPVSMPKVDYLLQNGGLGHNVPRNLLQGAGSLEGMPYGAAQPQTAASRIFEPFNRLLDDYLHVINKNGSVAVATGYRSVARRLLDRLEAVFARDISSESCYCAMCERDGMYEYEHGVSWGEVLEMVSGRKELPRWPPFTMAPSATGLENPTEENVPMQKMDIDIPVEYREHFIRQSRKTKQAVDKWLYEQQDQSNGVPDGVDDGTLIFAMLTHLEPERRSLFYEIMGIPPSTPVPRSNEHNVAPELDIITLSGLAIQRLYRLPAAPRKPETAIYMVDNPRIHHVLATLAAISDDEWEILISGRFDGFLRSGAEDVGLPANPSPPPRSNQSATPLTAGGAPRSPTPNIDGAFKPQSQPSGTIRSPASFGGPIALDEETEIVALAEVERDIYLGMEALEDAFEALHCKAEAVRRALRERGAGLSMANQDRRGLCVEAKLGTPYQGHTLDGETEDDYFDDLQSLAPDDSASNISSNRRRRPKRRTERRTPAPVKEEDGEAEEEKPHGGRRGFWRR